MTSRVLARHAIPRYAPASGDTEQAAIQRDYLGFLVNVAEQCGAIGQYQRRACPVVLVNAPELVRAILIDNASDLTKGDLQHTVFRALLGDSVSLSEGNRHGRLRRLLAPVFGRRHMIRYAEPIVQVADTVLADWADPANIDLFDALHRLTVRTLSPVLVAELALWVETGEFWQARERLWLWINSVAGERRGLADQADDTLAPQVTAAITTMRGAVDRVMLERQHHGPAEPGDLLTDILRANDELREPFLPSEVRDQVIALLFAAQETSAVALFWSLYLLAGHPDVRTKLERELDDALAGRLPVAADLAALPYTLQVVKESMRLYPPAARQFRVTVRDTTLAGHPVSAGTTVSLCHYVLHRSPASFPKADRFVPERFAPNAPPHHPLSYLPFGAGERICLGRHYAMQEIHLLLAMLVSRFRFTFPEVVPPWLAVTLRPPAGTRVTVRPRKHRGRPPSRLSHNRVG